MIPTMDACDPTIGTYDTHHGRLWSHHRHLFNMTTTVGMGISYAHLYCSGQVDSAIHPPRDDKVSISYEAK